MKNWLLLALIAAFPVAVADVRAQVIEREPEPKNWLAFVSRTAGMARTRSWITASTPEITLYRDGRVVWIQPRATGAGMWRVGRLSPEKVQRLKSIVSRSSFMELPPDPVRRERQYVSHMTDQSVGFSEGSRSRVVDVYGPEMFGALTSASVLSRTSIELAKVLRESLPREHQPYRPDHIRVGVMPAAESKLAVDWPLKEPPVPLNSTAGPYTYHSGAAAARIIAALEQSSLVRVGDRYFDATWAPALSTPDPGLSGYESGRPSPPTNTTKPERQLPRHSDAVTCVQWSPDGKYLVTATPSTDAPRLWAVSTGKAFREFEEQGPNYSIAWSPESKRILFGAGISFLRESTGEVVEPCPRKRRLVCELRGMERGREVRRTRRPSPGCGGCNRQAALEDEV